MLYYKFRIRVTDENPILNVSDDNYGNWTSEIKDKTTTYNEQNEGNPFSLNQFFVFNATKDYLIVCGTFGYRCKIKPEEAAKNFVTSLGFKVASVEDAEEIKISSLAHYAHMADHCQFLEDEDKVLMECSLGSYGGIRSANFQEHFISEDYSLEKAKLEAKKANCSNSLVAELERIYTPQKQTSFIGNPVHYLLYCDDKDSAKKISGIIGSALYANGRLKSKRMLFQDLSKLWTRRSHSVWDDDENTDLLVRNFFHYQKGGSLVLTANNLTGSNFAQKCELELETLAQLLDSYKVETLSIIVLDKGAKTLGETIKNQLPKVRFVEIEEESFYADTMKELLLEKAAIDQIEDTASLLDAIPKGNRAFCSKDVTEIYSNWLNTRLANEVYPQYKEIKTGNLGLLKPKGDAYTELQTLIGLKSAKTVIQQALDYHKAQNLYKKAGITDLQASKHMVFTGNPGTAKTTVARLFAQILKDNGVLSRGNLVEVGRKDLVGKYVGWTAKQVEDAFNKAKGSVLFIDEAYSLCEEKAGLYGDEAINTIVQMMENCREDTVVIFAGYPDRMQEFLDKNPGLRSRIAFNVNFDNYNTEELVEILQLFASKSGITLASGVLDFVRPLFDRAQKDPTFGNGRFVRNVFEQAKMRQATRLVNLDPETLTNDTIRTLLPEDFGGQTTFTLKDSKPLGFAC